MPNSPICVDASFLLRLLLDDESGSQADALWETWHREGRQLVAPTLLYYEVADALYRCVAHGDLNPDETEALLDLALRLEVELVGDAGLHRRALQMAQTFSLPATYDAYYLALAERLGAEFWTADLRLLRAVRDRLPWVHGLEETQRGNSPNIHAGG